MEEKSCSKCHETKPITAFAWSNKAKGRYCSHCRACQAVASRKWYQANREKQRAYVARNNARYRAESKAFLRSYLLDHPCVDCGEGDPALLQFDHVRGDKLASVGAIATWGRVNDRLIAEIAKCEVRCANCHRRRHTIKRRNAKARKARMMAIKNDLDTIETALMRLQGIMFTRAAKKKANSHDLYAADAAIVALARIRQRIEYSVPVEQGEMEMAL